MKSLFLALLLSITFHWSFFQIPTQSDRGPFEATGKRVIPIQITQRTRIPQIPVSKATVQKQSETETRKKTTPIPRPKPSKQETKTVTTRPKPFPIKDQKTSTTPNPQVAQPSIFPKAAKTIGQVLEKSEQQEQSGPVSLSFRDLKGGYQVMPVYPMAARRERRQGDILLKVEILESGFIGKLTVVRSSNSPDLDASAIDAVRQWRFEPAIRNGLPVQQTTLLPIRFDLRSD